ncbi:MAG: GGDEF domain-containing protein [Lachnospiraceae bacterium]|nr:GGDEF domain-containing protein [Lachnospiraceae bacterium]
MKRTGRTRDVFQSLRNYDWEENFELNKESVYYENTGLALNGSFIMGVVLIISAVLNFVLDTDLIIKYYAAAIPYLVLIFGVSYYYMEYKPVRFIGKYIAYIFSFFALVFSITVHINIDSIGGQNYYPLFIYVILFPVLIIDKPIPKLIFSIVVTTSCVSYIVMTCGKLSHWSIILISDIIIAAVTAYFFGCYTTWQKLMAFTRVRQEDYISRHDAATGLRNRRNFFLDFARYENEGGVSGVIVIDINDFKHINDTYGHLVGDDAILHVANILKEAGEEHLVHFYRYGGDEFVGIISKNCTCTVLDIAERVQKTVDNTPLCIIGSGELKLSISVGGAINHNNEDVEALLKRADENMYQDKMRIKAERAKKEEYK